MPVWRVHEVTKRKRNSREACRGSLKRKEVVLAVIGGICSGVFRGLVDLFR
jgi:hypothetical protein